ncbi:MAG: hypothetical protein WCK34_01760 [Bacteroidota bacterium]
MENKDFLSLFLSGLSLIISTLVLIRQISFAKKSNQLQVAIDVLREYRNIEFKNKVKIIFENIDSHDTAHRAFDDYPADICNALRSVSNFFDNIGLLIFHKLVDKEIIIGFMGENALTVWDKISPLILNIRDKSGMDYQCYYEHFVCLVQEKDPDLVRKGLKKTKRQLRKKSPRRPSRKDRLL